MLAREELQIRINQALNDSRDRVTKQTGGYPWFYKQDLFDIDYAKDDQCMQDLYAILKEHFTIRKQNKKGSDNE